MKFKIFFITIFSLSTAIGQTDEVNDLNDQRKFLISRIDFLKDSLNRLDARISKIVQENIPDNAIAYSYKGAELKDEPSLNGNIITQLPNNTELNIVLRTSGYVYVKTNFGYGYVSNAYVNSNNKSSSSLKSNSYSSKNYSTSSNKISKTSRSYFKGPRGGCYYINSNGNKSYVDRSLCNKSTEKSNSYSSKNYSTSSNKISKTSRSYYRGSRGGCYYINSNGNKSYVSRSLCNYEN